MLVTQIYELMNNVTSEILGKNDIIAEDLSNVVDVGVEIFNASSVDNYVRSLVDHIGKVIFVNRPYQGNAPSVVMDGWEFGAVCEKIQGELPEATVNESWELEDGASYDNQIFYKPVVSAKFFSKRVTFEVDRSFTEMQVKSSFSNAQQLNAFISMIYNDVEKSMTIKVDELVMRTINNFIAETIYQEYGANSLSESSHVKAVNLLYLYNETYSKSLAAADCFTDPDFIRFSAYIIGRYKYRLQKISTLFNIGAKPRFTRPDDLHFIMHADFATGADIFLQSDTFHNEYTKLDGAEVVPYWQGSGDDYACTQNTALNVTNTEGHTINTSGIVAVMFDRDALGVTNYNRRVTTAYNAKGEFINNYFKMDSGYFNDFNENFIVFFVA